MDTSILNCIKRLDAYVEAFYEQLLNAIWHYELWRIAAYDKKLIEGVGRHRAGVAFEALRFSLFNKIIQDVANLIFDEDKDNRVVSLLYFQKIISDRRVVAILRKRYAKANSRLRDEEVTKWECVFDERLNELTAKINSLTSEHNKDTLKKLRDKCTAHREVVLNSSERGFEFKKVTGVYFGDEKKHLDELILIFDLLFSLVLMKSFSWDSFYAPTKREVEAFWKPFLV
jgi:hypothetical protein